MHKVRDYGSQKDEFVAVMKMKRRKEMVKRNVKVGNGAMQIKTTNGRMKI